MSSTISTADHHHHHHQQQQKDKKMKGKMKTKMNKKCARKNDDVEKQEDVDDNENSNNNNNNNKNNGSCGKKRGRGSTLMEGSRCSRVNGRGWRCCQQTLVGYSLCEHHLGKGRLRSMTSVRSRSLAATAPSAADYYTNPNPPPPLSSSLLQEKDAEPVMVGNEFELGKDKEEDEDEDHHRQNQEEKNTKPSINITTKKRMKLGMVKARSISSLLLLGQTSTSAISVLHHNGK